MRNLFIITILATLLMGCRSKSVQTYSNIITNDSINTVINDSISITNNIDIKISQVEDIKTVIKEDIKEVITDSIAKTTTERVITRVIEQTNNKNTDGELIVQNDTISTKQEITNTVKDSKVVEDKQEETKQHNVMLYVFLSLVCIVVLIVLIKFF